ncbi:MAG: M2 family metallopeptidase [Lysobacteraceae bacterium]
MSFHRALLDRALLTLALLLVFALPGCSAKPPANDADAANTQSVDKGTQAKAAAFVDEVNAGLRADYAESQAAQWLAATDINADSQLVASKANERYLTMLDGYIEKARDFDGQSLQPGTARAIALLKLQSASPAPKDPVKLRELTQIATRLEGNYGAGRYCKDAAKTDCRQLGELEDVLRSSRDYDAQLDAWTGWHATASSQRADYQRYVALLNEGAKEEGYANAGELWRAGYDMSAADFQAETDRLWNQVKPMYDQLQCYTRTKLVKTYGERGQVSGMIPAHLTGNMWAQEWTNLWDLLAPYPNVPALDISAHLKAERDADFSKRLSALGRAPSVIEQADIAQAADQAEAVAITKRAEGFYVSLGMPKLPDTFWMRSQLIKPRDRDVVCHASAWDMDLQGDVRIKMCIKPEAESFNTIYHELGHLYYDLAYNPLPVLFQNGANDGFHEAIGDTIQLSMTPAYLQQLGLLDNAPVSDQAQINTQMRMALKKVAFLPFGLMIDRWRWGVFDGSINQANYNKAWWDLRAKYEGVAPPTTRGEEFFDAGAKYHVPANVPYTRYFLADILQFQFYRALCKSSGYSGPLAQCSFAGNAEAGKLYLTMLRKGASQPWQTTLKQMTGEDHMDASAILDYFSPLRQWLMEQNKDQECGWEGNFAGAP